MSTRRTRRTAATAEITEEIITVETRSKRTRPASRKAAVSKASKTAKDTTSSSRSNAQPAARPDAVASTPAPAPATTSAATPAPATNKRRLRSTTEAASPLRALDEQPAKKARTTSKKVSTPAPARVQEAPVEEDDDEETPIFFTKSFDHIAHELQISSLNDRNAGLQATCDTLREERDSALAELTLLKAQLADLQNELRQYTEPQISPAKANSPIPEFDSFDVEEPEPAKPSFMTGDASAMALLRHVQEASRPPPTVLPTSPASPASPASPQSPGVEIDDIPAVESPTPARDERPSTPSRSFFGTFTSSFSVIKNLFGASTQAPPTPTPSRRPPPGSMTEVLSMPPTPVGERPKRPARRPKKQSRMVKALLQGVDQQDIDQATAWAKQVAAELHKDSTSGDKRKRLEVPVLFRDLKHFPASKPWQSGFSFPEDILDLEDDDVVPAWAVYTSMIEEEHETKRTKTTHANSVEDDMPQSLNDRFGAFIDPRLDFHPRRAIDPSPMFDSTLRHQEGVNIFTAMHGHEAAASDREAFQREMKAGGSQHRAHFEKSTVQNSEDLRTHDPGHGSFSVPESDSEEEETPRAKPVWTQAPPPAPTPAHVSLPNATHNEEVERQRQKLMKHTPHKPSRLQQVSYPSPSLMSDAGDSPFKNNEAFGEIPEIEPLTFDDDPELAAAWAATDVPAGIKYYYDKMSNWSVPQVTYESEEEDLSPA
ncbi:hypothetical protein C7974DRAFT_212725 [Boeremia exigua]|uniref:uncharacterized protein n=1 Tax=Boeremia exigua TaxID=749465 RepID=UPI001E8EDEEA|nr:uncharacterized protein C7974DRAFT_212725 [Boeremia exigua]KAH6621893.1 hypothetical protein C7974DRAFT_212725 [Boeremia exigua]